MSKKRFLLLMVREDPIGVITYQEPPYASPPYKYVGATFHAGNRAGEVFVAGVAKGVIDGRRT